MNVEKLSRSVAVSDVALAADRIRLVAGDRGSDEPKKVLLDRAFAALHKINKKWTRRRVRALWGMEAARVDYREITEMEAVIAAARRRHAAYIEDTAKLRAYAAGLIASLEAGDADFHGGQIEGLREVLRRVDSAGAEGGGAR